MSTTVSEVIVETLLESGAKRCYGIVGDTINHFTNAIAKSPLEWVHVRHEEVGAFAAGAEAYMTDELTVCAGTCGPGSLHFVNGIYESHRNGGPVLLIASQVDSAEEGLHFPQEVDQKKVYEQCSVFCEKIQNPEQAKRIVVMAAQAALNKRGVAVVIVNGDMFKRTPEQAAPWRVHRSTPMVRPSDADLASLAALINSAVKPAIYAGIGAKHAQDSLIALAEKLQAPIAHTTRAKEFVEPNNPYCVGMTGILGNKAGLHAFEECDLLLCLGSDFAYTQFYPEQAQIVQVDIEASHLGRRTPIDLGLVGDVESTIAALLPLVDQKQDSQFLTQAKQQYQKDLHTYLERAESGNDLIHPQTVTHLLNELANDDAIFTADGGSPMVWLLRHLSANGKRRFLTSLAHGTMANAYPQALGISLAYPGRQVIAMCGDGGLSMLMGDLLTLAQEQIPVKLLVFNNHSLGFVEMEQRVEGMLDNYTELKNPNFAEVAKVVGLQGWKVTHTDELHSAMEQWLASDQPGILDVDVNRVELVMPPQIQASQVASTALFGVKAVLNGRADEVVALLRDNFVR
ncbi:thiamine pyrophosphate-dependent enzyme [Halioxenophilus aromaticivorans]|uniref:Thiamine pyrophosphate-binding protein n=1 Tax=Halioxenophilus aromaticivorans TaxID=1306992 RepID=A0AAV3U4A8_9ALTE